MRKLKKSFTLIELLIVVAIIGILAGVGIPMYNGYMANAKVAATKANHKTISSFMTAVHMKCSLGTTTFKFKLDPQGKSGNYVCSPTTGALYFAMMAPQHFKWEGTRNPFNETDNALYYDRTNSMPATIGRTNISAPSGSNRLVFNTRWGNGNDETLSSSFEP